MKIPCSGVLPCSGVQDEDYGSLIERLKEAGIVGLGSIRLEVNNGVFAPPKSDPREQRLIIDAKNVNLEFMTSLLSSRLTMGPWLDCKSPMVRLLSSRNRIWAINTWNAAASVVT